MEFGEWGKIWCTVFKLVYGVETRCTVLKLGEWQ